MSSIRLYSVLVFGLLGCTESHAALSPGGQNLFVAAAADGMVALSADGVLWEHVGTGASDDMNDVAFGEGRVVALSSAGEVFTSANGRTWRSTVLEEDGGDWSSPEWSHVAYSGDRFLALGTSWDDGIHAFVSDDGVDWRRIEAPRVRVASVTPIDGSFYITAWHLGDLPEIYTYIVAGDVFEAAAGPDVSSGIRVGEVSYAPGAVTYSTRDGRTWQSHGGPRSQSRAIAYGDGTFVSVGELNTIHRSTDLDEWTITTTPLDEFAWFRDVAFGAGRFVAVGDEVVQSAGGLTWERTESAGALRAIVYAEFVDEPAAVRVPCPADHPGEICGDTYCEYCEDGTLRRCATIEIEGDPLPLC